MVNLPSSSKSHCFLNSTTGLKTSSTVTGLKVSLPLWVLGTGLLFVFDFFVVFAVDSAGKVTDVFVGDSGSAEKVTAFAAESLFSINSIINFINQYFYYSSSFTLATLELICWMRLSRPSFTLTSTSDFFRYRAGSDRRKSST